MNAHPCDRAVRPASLHAWLSVCTFAHSSAARGGWVLVSGCRYIMGDPPPLPPKKHNKRMFFLRAVVGTCLERKTKRRPRPRGLPRTVSPPPRRWQSCARHRVTMFSVTRVVSFFFLFFLLFVTAACWQRTGWRCSFYSRTYDRKVAPFTCLFFSACLFSRGMTRHSEMCRNASQLGSWRAGKFFFSSNMCWIFPYAVNLAKGMHNMWI